MKKLKVPLQRRFLRRSIEDALGNLPLQDYADQLGYDYATISRWLNSTDPGKPALRQIYLRMHGPKGGVATHDSAEEEAQDFIDSFTEIRDYQENLRTIDAVSSPVALQYLKDIKIIDDAGPQREIDDIGEKSSANHSFEISISPTRNFSRHHVTIKVFSDGETTINALVEKIEDKDLDVFNDDRESITITYDSTIPDRNSDGEYSIQGLWLTVIEPSDKDLIELDEILTITKNEFADDRTSKISFEKIG